MDIDDDDAIDGNQEQDDFAHLDAAPDPVVAHDDEDDTDHDASSESDDTHESADDSQSEHEEPAWRTVTVKSGDSLSAIAKRELGNGNRWREIFEANRDKLSNPDLIHPGQVLKLPH